jgi:RNA polymerase sigma factor (sigma-70 family)
MLLTQDLIKAAQAGCEKSKAAIVKQWTPWVYKISRKAYQTPRPGVSLEDVAQEGMIGLLKAIDTYNFKYAFSTWSYWQILGAVGGFTRKQFKHAQYPICIEDADRKFNLEDESQNYQVRDALPPNLIETLIKECAGGEKTKRAQIVRDRFGLGTEQLDTAQCVEKYGINRFAVSAHCTAFKAKVRAKFPELADFA